MTRSKPTLTRRGALGVAGLGAAGLAFGSSVAEVRAAAPMAGPAPASVNRVKLGDFEVTTILDGAVVFDGPHPIFGADQDAKMVQDLAEANFLPRDKMAISFTPVLVNTGAELVLFDSGTGAGRRPNAGKLRATLAAAGVTPEDVDVLVITHFHGDHIGGLMEDGAPAFPNARYVTSENEYNFWTHPDRMSGPTEGGAKLVAANVKPFAEKMTFIKDEGTVVGGITGVAAFGHTPGHMAFHIESGGRRLLLTADTANHFIVSLQKPDWHVRFDADKAAAAATRKKIFGMVAADRIPFTGYHMPFPALGYVEAMGEGFRYVPASYQFEI